MRVLWLYTCCLLVSVLSAELLEEFVFEDPPFASCHASTLVETSSGKLLCAYFAGSEEGAKDVGIWLSVRSAEGWSAPRLVAKDPEVPCWNPVLFSFPSGEILLFYKVGPHPCMWSGALKRSFDEGVTWSADEYLPAGIIGPVKNKPLLLDDGTLLCGSSVETWRRWGCWIDRTSDRGKTWTKSAPINLEHDVFGMIQPTLFFSSEKTLRLLARSLDTGYICSSTSEDGGKTWSFAKPIELPNPNAAVDAVRLQDGRILLAYNHSATERTPLCLALSGDGGQHWSRFSLLEDEPGEYSYPCIIQTKDGKVHVCYTFNRVQIKHVIVEVL